MKKKTRNNLVVVVDYATYCNIKNTYKPHTGLESFEKGNDKTEEDEDADTSNNDKDEDNRSDSVEMSAARQGRVQNDGDKELGTGDASNKRRFT